MEGFQGGGLSWGGEESGVDLGVFRCCGGVGLGRVYKGGRWWLLEEGFPGFALCFESVGGGKGC